MQVRGHGVAGLLLEENVSGQLSSGGRRRSWAHNL